MTAVNDYQPDYDREQWEEVPRQNDASLKEKETLCEDISFSLTEEEAYICLKNAGIFKTSGKRAVLYTLFMAIAAAGFFISYIFGQNYNWLIFAVICLLVIAVIWIVPYVQLKKLAKENAKGDVIRASVREDMIEIKGDGSRWEIPLNRTSRLSEKGNMLIFHTENGQLFTIPERAVPPEKLAEIKKIVKRGTVSYRK